MLLSTTTTNKRRKVTFTLSGTQSGVLSKGFGWPVNKCHLACRENDREWPAQTCECVARFRCWSQMCRLHGWHRWRLHSAETWSFVINSHRLPDLYIIDRLAVFFLTFSVSCCLLNSHANSKVFCENSLHNGWGTRLEQIKPMSRWASVTSHSPLLFTGTKPP